MSLINPAKSELGKVSKIIIEKINSKVREASFVNQWKNTNDVINWFNNIDDKSHSSFLQFDIEEFYPSISKDLVTKAINYANQFTPISKNDTEIIMHARKSLLFSNNNVWVKNVGDSKFDVTMGSYDGAEICELVGLYILHTIGEKYGHNNLGLYRDDGLACLHGISGPASDRIRKEFEALFKEKFGLRITIASNLKSVNFLDVTFNLTTGKYQPYKKPNDHPVYINTKSNHPPNIIKVLPESISRRISDISSNEQIFDTAAPYYNDALSASGYNEKITYKSDVTPTDKGRKRNIIWFNPPYSMNVTTNIAKCFLNLIDKHFPKRHKLHKIFNRNNVKVSYSCLPNVASIVTSHNKTILSNNPTTDSPKCNCRKKESCPLEGNCLDKNVIYRCNLKTDISDDGVNYIGLTENTFKDRLYKHRNSFKYESKANSTELSKHVWQLKNSGNTNPILNWSIVDHSSAYRNGSKMCNLCLTEKYHVINSPLNLINKRSELISKCRHENKFYLTNYKAVPPDFQN